MPRPESPVPNAIRGTLVLLAFVAACHRQGEVLAGDPAPRLGTYTFEANIGRYQMRGIVLFLEDTAIVQPDAEYCQLPATPPDHEDFRYECMGNPDVERVTLRVNRRHPISASRWSATIAVRRQRTVCDQYSVNANGQRVCTRTRTETYEDRTTQSGILRLRPQQSG